MRDSPERPQPAVRESVSGSRCHLRKDPGSGSIRDQRWREARPEDRRKLQNTNHHAALALRTMGHRFGDRLQNIIELGGIRQQFRARADEQFPAEGEIANSIAVAEQTIVANPLEAGRNDMEEKAADELVVRQRHLARELRFGRAIILILKRHLPVFKSGQTLVAEGDPMGVPSEILNDLLGAAEGRLGINDPFALAGRLEMLLECIGAAEGFE